METPKNETVKVYGRTETDTGSSEVQIALLTDRIKHLTEHLRSNKRDHSTRRGLLAMVSRRRKLIAYLQRTDFNKYIEVTDRLGIRRAK